jgi:hypothetical protein
VQDQVVLIHQAREQDLLKLTLDQVVVVMVLEHQIQVFGEEMVVPVLSSSHILPKHK